MSIAGIINDRIEKIEVGAIFSYGDFNILPERMDAMAAALYRLASKGVIKRFGKGKYYKPKNGIFGEVPLMENQVLESILKKNGSWIGYITGTSAYNKLGLTTQITNEFTIATNELRKPIKLGRVKARFVKSYGKIEEKNIPLLQLLDAIKDFKNIPGTDPNTAINLLKIKLKELSSNERTKLVQLALNYPPSTRAVLGALLEFSINDSIILKLYKSLNPLSTYDLKINSETLPNKNKWNIK